MPVKKPDTPAAASRIKAPLDRHLDQQLFRALSDGNRLAVFSCLVKVGRACSASEVAECCEVDFSVVNKHLKILNEAGLLDAEKRGRVVWYSARCGELCDRLSALIDSIAAWCPNIGKKTERDTGASCCGSGAVPKS